jgi:hypothetical protein
MSWFRRRKRAVLDVAPGVRAVELPRPVEATPAAPSITTQLDADLLVKFNDRDYLAAATERWIPAVQQILRTLEKLRVNQGTFLVALGDVGDRLSALEASIKALLPGPVVRVTIKPIEVETMDFTIGDTQFQDFAIGGLDAVGVAEDPGAVIVNSSDPNLATCAPSPADVVAPANSRAYRVTSAKQGAGVVAFTVLSEDGSKTLGVFNCNIVAGAVASVSVQPIGTPQEIPA